MSDIIYILAFILLLFIIFFIYIKINKSSKDDIAIIENLKSKLLTKENQCRILFENLSEFIIVLQESIIVVANPKVMQHTGYEFELLGKSFNSIVYEDDIDIVNLMMKAIIDSDLENSKAKFRIKKPDGDLLWVESKAINSNWNDKPSIMLLLLDITKKRNTEEKLSFICYHDQLTGLYNRRYFEEELKRVDTLRNYPIAVVMIDVNGLKLINDAFGHKNGDELIKTVANILNQELRSDDIVSRIGGDEFCLITTKSKEEDINALIKRIETAASSKKIQDIPISIAIGYALKKDEKISMAQLVNSADVMMYQKKLSQRAKLRKEAIEIILNNLENKYPQEKEHAYITSQVCNQVGAQLGFTQTQLLEVITLGYYHDIGKIALNESILNNKGTLSQNEWDNLKRHPETGYSILSSSNEFASIADSVLSHHERWDGKGYPKGIKGEEIPIYSRVLAVAETYDSLTRKQSYREPLNSQQAIDIIKENAGTQFDPKVVNAFIKAII